MRKVRVLLQTNLPMCCSDSRMTRVHHYSMILLADFSLTARSATVVDLTPSHLQLSSQVPSTWLHGSSDNLTVDQKAVESVKKVAWRAMLEGLISNTSTETTKRMRLGRLNDKAYKSWSTFITSASERLQITGYITLADDQRELLERRLTSLHVLRCLLGPCVESLIIWDRFMWATELVGKLDPSMEVELINLFDQRQGSGRNVAIVLKPR
jgi:hypothetical protein